MKERFPESMACDCATAIYKRNPFKNGIFCLYITKSIIQFIATLPEWSLDLLSLARGANSCCISKACMIGKAYIRNDESAPITIKPSQRLLLESYVQGIIR